MERTFLLMRFESDSRAAICLPYIYVYISYICL